jgi:hypothetical protein
MPGIGNADELPARKAQQAFLQVGDCGAVRAASERLDSFHVTLPPDTPRQTKQEIEYQRDTTSVRGWFAGRRDARPPGFWLGNRRAEEHAFQMIISSVKNDGGEARQVIGIIASTYRLNWNDSQDNQIRHVWLLSIARFGATEPMSVS